MLGSSGSILLWVVLWAVLSPEAGTVPPRIPPSRHFGKRTPGKNAPPKKSKHAANDFTERYPVGSADGTVGIL